MFAAWNSQSQVEHGGKVGLNIFKKVVTELAMKKQKSSQ